MSIPEGDQDHRPVQGAISIAEFCRRYGVGRTTLYEQLKIGRLRCRKVGKRSVIAVDDAEDWLRRLPVMKPGV